MTDGQQQTRVERLKHVYHTRVRTTTVVLIVLWFALLALYGFTSHHYPPKDAVKPTRTTEQPVDTQAPVTEPSETTSRTPSTSVESTTESTPEPTDGTEQTTGQTQSTTPLPPRRTAPLPTQLMPELDAPDESTDTTPGSGDGR
ncbi:hypothetical protein L5G28_07355 [Gordonia sp. HY285]|uniref:hypothetical protein n=1 Tax=Gordonia liuliyuniae TaxID=2911517 RepID=UPI001F16423B|nr:hypothetical protein [Gordonia liuliyuniae]MCF8609978.1 hypothetical protein [Gordonia liuliyuniae]